VELDAPPLRVAETPQAWIVPYLSSRVVPLFVTKMPDTSDKSSRLPLLDNFRFSCLFGAITNRRHASACRCSHPKPLTST